MMDNEVPLNRQQDSGQENQELTPWMQKRLEERARPLNSQGLLQIVHHGGQLARWVIKRTGLSSVISRVGNLSFLSRASRVIARRSASVEPSDIYRMLDLPWFRAGDDQSQEKIDSSRSSEREEPTSSKAKRQMPESQKKTEATGHKKTSETYIHRLISPPISRKISPSIGTSSVRVQQKKDIVYSSGTETHQEKSAASSLKRMSEVPVSPITGTQKVTNAGQLEAPRSYGADNAKKTASKVDSQPKDAYLEPSSQSSQQVLRAIEAAEKSTVSIAKQGRQQISPSVETSEKGMPFDIQRSKQKLGDSETRRVPEIAESPIRGPLEIPAETAIVNKFDIGKAKKEDTTSALPVKETTGKHEATKKLQRDELSSTRVESRGKEASEVYPAQDLLHKKPMSIGQKIVQSLPFIKNIIRKENQPLKPVMPVEEKRPEIKESNAAPKKIEMVHRDEGASGMIQESPSSFDIEVTDQIKKEVTHVPPEPKEVKNEKPGVETVTSIKLPISRKYSEGEATRQVYPAKDLFHRKPLMIGQQIMRSLPIIGNVYRRMGLPSQPVTDVREKPYESYRRLPLTEIETPPIREVESISDMRQTPLPVAPGVMVGKGPMISRKEVPAVDNLGVLPDFMGAAKTSKLELVLAPVGQTSLALQQDNYVETEDATQNIQRAPMPSVGQSTIQTQPEPLQQPSTTQITVMRSTDDLLSPHNNQIDIRALAREIYPLIRRMIAIERERRPSR